MKKILILMAGTVASLNAAAQNMQFGDAASIDRNAFQIISMIVMVILIMNFCITLLKKILDHRLKNKIIDNGIAQDTAASILHESNGENKNAPVKWFALLAGAGAGLTIINYTLPVGIHSLAIMSFCIAFSFLGYYVFVRKNEKEG